ncbi:hypothetical protein ACSDR0_05345 [Streptosporangium sp. G11]|uniref:hypothetical protein n=1 Tax=Streptosporangium sp. G11 TaxID=3436926 RepID=UPI003EBDD32F
MAIVLTVTTGVPAQLSAAWAVGPYLAVNGADLAGTSVGSPFTVTLTGEGTVDDGVKFLLNNVYLGKDSTAPYQWTVTAAVGARALYYIRRFTGSGSPRLR